MINAVQMLRSFLRDQETSNGSEHVGLEPEHISQAIASLTMLRLLGEQSTTDMPEQLAFELLPHVVALAQREMVGNASRPLVAFELHAYAALCHLTRGRTRSAAVQLGYLNDISTGLSPLSYNTIDTLEDWDPAVPHHPEPVVKRMGKLVRAIRTAGFPDAATTVFEALRRLLPPANDDLGAADSLNAWHLPRLRFEGALAYHDSDLIDIAKTVLGDAQTEWKALGSDEALAACLSFDAELDFDAGHFAPARTNAEAARLTRERLLRETAHPGGARAVSDVARSDLLLGRLAYATGRLRESEQYLDAAVDGWSRVADHRRFVINLITSQSFQALVKALLGDIEAAESIIDPEIGSLNRPQGEATILSNTAQVLRIAGRLNEAVVKHERAMIIADRTWGPQHRTTMLIRRKYADTLLAAGRPADASHQLIDLLEYMRREGPLSGEATSGRMSSVARACASVGQLLIENSLAIQPLPQEEITRLRDAEEILELALLMYDRATDGNHPGKIPCFLGLSEIAIRLAPEEIRIAADGTGEVRRRPREPDDAEVFARMAYDLVLQHQGPGASALLLPEARGVRARAGRARPQPDQKQVVDALRSEVTDMLARSQGRFLPLADRFELALARAEVGMAEWHAKQLHADAGDKQIMDAEANSVYSEARQLFDDALVDLYAAIGGQPHQLASRAYAELAAIAYRLGLPRHQARVERERQRLRPSLDNEYELKKCARRLLSEVDRLDDSGADQANALALPRL